MGNGFSIAALTGKKEIMELGGFYHDRERVFLLSTTQGAEDHSLAVALATIRFYKENQMIEKMKKSREDLRRGINKTIQELKIIVN